MCDHSGEERETPSVSDRMADAARHAAHLSHEARAAKSLVEDTIEDGVHAARRAVKSVRRGIERLEDARDEGIHSVKRRPLTAVAVAAGAGLMLGLAAGWIARRFSSDRSSND